ncbi:LacI family DNA-binding transcriptional regulator [Cellulomonas sp. 73-145]|nr:LacI family DNA-binding transcriptional regulator [Cellulomonas sp. 73-145]
MSERASIRDVAVRAGVSPTTVSHVLNNTPGTRTSEKTRARVHAAAAELGYSANAVARALRTRRSDSVGFVGDEIATTPFAGKLILGAQEVVRQHDGVLLVTNTSYDAELENREIRELLSRDIDGVLYAAMYHRVVTVPASLHAAPVVVLNARTNDDRSWVSPDEYAGGEDAAQVLIDAGHRRLAMIGNADPIPAASGRPAGFLARAAAAGIPSEDVTVVYVSPTAGHAAEAAMRLLDRPDRPTGLFCFNDLMAMGAYNSARRLGLRIPDDLSVVGFDDLAILSAAVDPALTTVALPHLEMGAWAAEQLYVEIAARATGQPSPVRHAELRGEVVHRASVGSPPR